MLLDELSACARRGLTFAPEAGTQRMRDVVNKNVTEEQLMETARARVLARLGQDEALLHDRPADRGGRGRARHRRDRRARAARSAGALVGQGAPRSRSASPRTCPSRTRRSSGARWTRATRSLRKQALLRDDGARARGVKLRMHDSQRQLCSRACSRAATAASRDVHRARVPRAARASTRWDEQLELERLAAKRSPTHGVEPARLPRHASRRRARLPWDHIDVGLEDGFLPREYRKALQEPAQPAVRQGRRACSSTTRTSKTPRPIGASSSATTAASPAT